MHDACTPTSLRNTTKFVCAARVLTSISYNYSRRQRNRTTCIVGTQYTWNGLIENIPWRSRTHRVRRLLHCAGVGVLEGLYIFSRALVGRSG